MKLKKLLLIAILLCSYTSSAQEVDIADSLFSTPQEQFEFITENLDFSDVASGLLLDKAIQILPIENFHGQSIVDSNLCDGMRYGA
ncbi:hypothetical protein JYT72_03070, partial [Crocinitomix catalasitica]|nr:hypothetical protein [Crocinitomix catalasitica]